MNTERKIKNKRTFDLEDRLIDFAIRISEVAEALPNTGLGKYIKVYKRTNDKKWHISGIKLR